MWQDMEVQKPHEIAILSIQFPRISVHMQKYGRMIFIERFWVKRSTAGLKACVKCVQRVIMANLTEWAPIHALRTFQSPRFFLEA
jgi:hypothetical protein